MYLRIPIDASDLTEILERLITVATLTQEQIDNLSTAINTAVTNIRQDIADLKAQIPNLDTSALDASVAALQALDLENPVPPADSPPA